MNLRTIKGLAFNVYLLTPGSKYLFLLIKKLWTPPYKWRKYMRFKGAFGIDLGGNVRLRMMNHGNTIENELFWLGSKGWEGRATSAWKELSKQSSVIFDVGANTGLYSLICARVNPRAAIYAFEPLPDIVRKLKYNLDLNHLEVQVNTLALAEEDGEGKIFTADTISRTFDQASLNEKNKNGVARSFVMIKKKRLSSFIEEQGIGTIDLMKIDVETYEPRVLAGMGKYLSLFAPTLLVEILNEEIGKEVEALVAGIGYHFYLIDEKKGFIAKNHLVPNRKGNNFLLLNKVRHPNFEIPT